MPLYPHLRTALARRLTCSAIATAFGTMLLLLPAIANAQPTGNSPWERVATSFQTVFVGPIAKGFSIVALVICGLSVATMEAGAKRTIAGVIFGIAMAVLAVQFLSWLTGVSA
jgi:type IV secretory pathway VirB2 component (pilin)